MQINIWQSIKKLIKRLFGVDVKQTDTAITTAVYDVQQYQNILKTNLTAIVSNALSVLTFGESSVNITDGNGNTTKRTDYLNVILQKHWKTIKQSISAGNGCGMIASIPYSVNGKIYINTITKDRLYITDFQGDEITKLTVLADIYAKDEYNIYLRFTDYSIENGQYIVRQKAVKNNEPIALTEVEQWANIPEEIHITGVDRLPIGIYKCPASSRRPDTIEGVPITYGCSETMNKIATCLMDIETEYKDKKVKIFADTTLFDKNDELTDLYKSFAAGGKLGSGAPIEIFDPAFRDTAYFNKLEHYFALLEKEIGTSRGILTDLQADGNATATEIRRATYQTYSLCDDIRTNVEHYLNDLMYGVDVLANLYSGTPQNNFKLTFDWGYGLLEDSEVTQTQYLAEVSAGLMSDVEYRMRTYKETEQEARAALDKVKVFAEGGDM